MKKIALLLFTLLLIMPNAFSQNTVEKTLAANMASMEKLNQLLSTEYTSILKLETVLPSAGFLAGEIRCISPYGDAGANEQTRQIQAELNGFLNGSKWAFGKNSYERPEFGLAGKLQITAESKTETLDYTSSGALFKPLGLIDGLDIQMAVYQHKTNPKSFLFLFPVSTICTAVMVVTKQ